MRFKPTSALWELVGRLANTTLTVRISGETGVGKEAVARLICRHYPHAEVTFLKIDCRQLKTGATGSPMNRLNRLLDSPQRHVVYLEHIEYTPDEIQDRLLRLLDVKHPGSPPWIIVSSLQPLERFHANGHFSKDLYQALDTVQIVLPPIRSKSERIPQILSWIMNLYTQRMQSGRLSLPAMDEMERLVNYPWPRNWHQLQAFVKNAIAKTAWDVSSNSSLTDDALSQEIDDVAAIYILSMAKLRIQREKVLEKMMEVSGLDEIGLLDLAIFSEAVNQIATLMAGGDDAQN